MIQGFPFDFNTNGVISVTSSLFIDKIQSPFNGFMLIFNI